MRNIDHIIQTPMMRMNIDHILQTPMMRMNIDHIIQTPMMRMRMNIDHIIQTPMNTRKVNNGQHSIYTNTNDEDEDEYFEVNADIYDGNYEYDCAKGKGQHSINKHK